MEAILGLTAGQAIVFGTLGSALVLFAVGRVRYDIVAVLALLVVVLAGIVPAGEAFAGFGHPAVVTVAAVLMLSRALFNSGLTDLVAGWMARVGGGPSLQVAALTGVVALCSGFMNNVGALALLMPVAIQVARRTGQPPSLLLMPLAFGSLLGGLTTLIGTPPNIIVSTFRAQTGAPPFGVFAFTPVGGAVAVAGVLFIGLLGWRLIPRRTGQASRAELFPVTEYLTEVRVPEGSRMAGQYLYDLEAATDGDVTVVGLVRSDRRVPAPSSFETLRPGDVLIVRADTDALKARVEAAGLEFMGGDELREETIESDEIHVMEAIVMPNSPVEGETASTLRLRWRYGVNLLAVARHGHGLHERVSRIHLEAGDIMLLQGTTGMLQQALRTLKCAPLAEREFRIGRPRRMLLATAIFAAALAAAASGLLSVQVAFAAAVVAMVVTGPLPARELYDSVDWSVIVLLGAMMPLGQALERTGGAELIARGFVTVATALSPAWAVAVLLVATMLLSDIVNNAAAAVLMAPIALDVARDLGASSDSFLMAVAIGASCAFNTPIGHQSNTLVMGPGGYRFGDYWRLGLPLDIVIVAVAVPLLLRIWPLF